MLHSWIMFSHVQDLTLVELHSALGSPSYLVQGKYLQDFRDILMKLEGSHYRETKLIHCNLQYLPNFFFFKTAGLKLQMKYKNVPLLTFLFL